MDTKQSNRPERRTALGARELDQYAINIAALSETRFAGCGELTEVGSGYSFFWSGKSVDEPREAGVGFAIRTTLVQKLESLPKGVNDRLMVMRLPIATKTYLTIISAYAPTMQYEDRDKEAFYEKLSEVVQETSKSDKLLLLGDFNARVGSDLKA